LALVSAPPLLALLPAYRRQRGRRLGGVDNVPESTVNIRQPFPLHFIPRPLVLIVSSVSHTPIGELRKAMELSKQSLLLVEDDALLALMEKKQLEARGYKVQCAENGEEALAGIRSGENRFDLVLMDIDLGDGPDGTEIAEIILRERDIPILFLSSHTEIEMVEKTERITSYGYVVKNSGIVVLEASIKMALKLFNAKLSEKTKGEELKKTEERYRTIFETAPIAIVFTRGTDILFANQSYLSMFEIPSLGLLKSYEPLHVFSPEWRPKILENIERRAAGLPVPNSYAAECVKTDGTVFPVLMHFTRTDFPDGPATIGFIIDMTDYRKTYNCG
jgi:PAS domain S-box-containing protein